MFGLTGLVDDEWYVRDSDDCVSWLVDCKSSGSTSGKTLADDHVLGKFFQSFIQKMLPFFGICKRAHKNVF